MGPESPSREHCGQIALLGVWAILWLGATTMATGCRSFPARNRELGMTEARQFSLRGADALQLNKFDDAEALFSEALRRCSTDERAHWGLAEVHAHKGNCQAAQLHLQEASRLSGNNPDMVVRLGEMHLAAGQVELAHKQAESALSVHRNHAGAWQLKGRICQEQQRWQEAVDCYHRSLMARPNSPEVQMSLAEIYLAMGRPQRALATLERMSDLQSSDYQQAGVYLQKGLALASLGQTDDAQECLREATSRASGSDYRLFLNVAKLQTDLGQIAEARFNLGRALSLQPSNDECLALQVRLDQQFASLVSTEQSAIKGVMTGITPQPSTVLEPKATLPVRESIYQIPNK